MFQIGRITIIQKRMQNHEYLHPNMRDPNITRLNNRPKHENIRIGSEKMNLVYIIEILAALYDNCIQG